MGRLIRHKNDFGYKFNLNLVLFIYVIKDLNKII